MTVAECRKRMTLREFACWVYRFRREIEAEQKNALSPDRSDYYRMQIAAEIRLLRYSKSRTRKTVKLSDFILKSSEEIEDQPVKNIQNKTAQAQAALLARVSKPGQQVAVPDFDKWRQQLMKS